MGFSSLEIDEMAAEAYLEASKVAATDDPVAEAECLEQAARCWRMANKMVKACELYRTAAKIYLKRNRPIKAGTIYDLISKLPNISIDGRIESIRLGIDAFEQANDG